MSYIECSKCGCDRKVMIVASEVIYQTIDDKTDFNRSLPTLCVPCFLEYFELGLKFKDLPSNVLDCVE